MTHCLCLLNNVFYCSPDIALPISYHRKIQLLLYLHFTSWWVCCNYLFFPQGRKVYRPLHFDLMSGECYHLTSNSYTIMMVLLNEHLQRCCTWSPTYNKPTVLLCYLPLGEHAAVIAAGLSVALFLYQYFPFTQLFVYTAHFLCVSAVTYPTIT